MAASPPNDSAPRSFDNLSDSIMETPMPSVALACPHLLDVSSDTPRLVGSQCVDCGEVYFPATRGCTHCLSRRMVRYDLGNSGTLWSWTIQGFLPKAPYNSGETPETFAPYGVGYVEMDCGVKVESRLTSADPAVLRIGMPLDLILLPYRHTDAGEAVFTFAFKARESVQENSHHE